MEAGMGLLKAMMLVLWGWQWFWWWCWWFWWSEPPCDKDGSSEGHVEAAKEQVGHGEVDDEDRCRVPHLIIKMMRKNYDGNHGNHHDCHHKQVNGDFCDADDNDDAGGDGCGGCGKEKRGWAQVTGDHSIVLFSFYKCFSPLCNCSSFSTNQKPCFYLLRPIRSQGWLWLIFLIFVGISTSKSPKKFSGKNPILIKKWNLVYCIFSQNSLQRLATELRLKCIRRLI